MFSNSGTSGKIPDLFFRTEPITRSTRGLYRCGQKAPSPGSRQMLHIALKVPLRFFRVRGRGQRDDAYNGDSTSGDAFDVRPFGRVPPSNSTTTFRLFLNPPLQLYQFHLQLFSSLSYTFFESFTWVLQIRSLLGDFLLDFLGFLSFPFPLISIVF